MQPRIFTDYTDRWWAVLNFLIQYARAGIKCWWKSSRPSERRGGASS